jgi:hypothetical protein
MIDSDVAALSGAANNAEWSANSIFLGTQYIREDPSIDFHNAMKVRL